MNTLPEELVHKVERYVYEGIYADTLEQLVRDVRNMKVQWRPIYNGLYFPMPRISTDCFTVLGPGDVVGDSRDKFSIRIDNIGDFDDILNMKRNLIVGFKAASYLQDEYEEKSPFWIVDLTEGHKCVQGYKCIEGYKCIKNTWEKYTDPFENGDIVTVIRDKKIIRLKKNGIDLGIAFDDVPEKSKYDTSYDLNPVVYTTKYNQKITSILLMN